MNTRLICIAELIRAVSDVAACSPILLSFRSTDHRAGPGEQVIPCHMVRCFVLMFALWPRTLLEATVAGSSRCACRPSLSSGLSQQSNHRGSPFSDFLLTLQPHEAFQQTINHSQPTMLSSRSRFCIAVSFYHISVTCTKEGYYDTTLISVTSQINPLKPELNPICYLLALLGAHHFFHVSRIRVKLLTLRWLMSYIWSTHSWCF